MTRAGSKAGALIHAAEHAEHSDFNIPAPSKGWATEAGPSLLIRASIGSTVAFAPGHSIGPRRCTAVNMSLDLGSSAEIRGPSADSRSLLAGTPQPHGQMLGAWRYPSLHLLHWLASTFSSSLSHPHLFFFFSLARSAGLVLRSCARCQPLGPALRPPGGSRSLQSSRQALGFLLCTYRPASLIASRLRAVFTCRSGGFAIVAVSSNFGGQPPLQSGVMALPTSPAGSRRGSADSEHAAHIPRPRVGIVVKNNATAPQFRGAIFDDDLTARDEYGNESSATLSDTSADPRSVVDDQVPSRPGAFESNPDQVLYTLPLTKVDGVHVKASQELQPVDHFKRHLEAAHHRLAAIRRRRVESVLLSERGEEAPPAGFGESAIPLDPSLNVGGADQDVPTPDPIEASQESGPRLWRGTGTGHFGRDPAVVRLPARKRLLGGLIGALGGDTSATPSGFSGSNSSSANSTASDSEDQAATWNEPVSKIRGNPSSSKDNSIGYPIKALEVATSAAVTSAQHTTAEQSLGLDIEANDVGYIATIQIGSNHKPFRMLIDSGSADTWVASSSCTGCGTHHQRLGPETSKSFKPTSNKFSITYGTGSVSGLLGHDEVDIAGLKLSNHTIGVALQQSRDFTDATVPFDGLMGLARSELSNAGTPTPIDALFASGQVSAPVMGYRLGRVADGRNDGEVTFGGVDRQRFTGNLIEVENISKEGFWEAAMGGVSFGGRDIGLHGRTAILDTGTTLIVAPKEDADAVHAAIPGSKSDGQGGYYIPCTTTQSLALTFGGQSFPIDPRDMLFLPVDQDDLQGDCISAISSGQVGQDNEWLVGAVWLKNLYFATNSRTNTIGLGKLKSS